MSKLSEKTHWDYIHVQEGASLRRQTFPDVKGSLTIGQRIRQSLKRLAGESLLDKMKAYDDYLLWNVIFPRHLPDLAGAKVVEVGSAPGSFLVQFSRAYGCIPYGVEYSEVGVDVNRKVFEEAGFDPENVIHADFFSDDFLRTYRGAFQAVVSRGFIEHFDDVTPVVNRHLELLAPGGCLIMSVPNLRGFNKLLARVFDKGAIPRHNLNIMRDESFRRIFASDDIKALFSGYYGTFSLYLFTPDKNAFKRNLLKAINKLQPFLNLAFRGLFRDKGAESRFFSPSLLFIGKKAENY